MDFGKWISETTEYDKIVSTLLITEKNIIKANEQGKIKIIVDELKWDDDCDDKVIEFTDNGERGMARQAESVIELLKEIDEREGKNFWRYVSKEMKEKIRRFAVKVALNECNWNIKSALETDVKQRLDREKEEEKSSVRVWKMTQEQSKEKEELFKKATAEGLTKDNILDILVVDE